MYKKLLKQLFAWKGNDGGDITKVYKIRNSRDRENGSNNSVPVIRRQSLVRRKGNSLCMHRVWSSLPEDVYIPKVFMCQQNE